MVKKAENTIVGISVGDLNGIGVEVILKTFEDVRMLEMCTPVLFANVKMISFLKKIYKSNLNFNGIDDLSKIIPGKINVFNVWREGATIELGTEDAKIGELAIKSFVSATAALKEGKIDTLVTAPINKHNIQSDDFKFPGHTDYLNQELDGDALMLMTHRGLRIGLLTDHVPVSEVSKHINEALIDKKVTTLLEALKSDFGISKPKIALLGLNPHCGDNGVIGKEDDEVIIPTIKKLFEKGKMVFGPFSADSFFGGKNYENYDAVLACYHDQGLVPFKTLAFGSGVNYTAGLAQIRTSPDHGTGFDIAGKDKANEQSFRNAVYMAIDVFKTRKEYEELTENPLSPKKINKK